MRAKSPTIQQAADLYRSGQIPWVTWHEDKGECLVIKGRRADTRCRSAAHWEFTSVWGDLFDTPSGRYCWQHLIHHAGGSMWSLARLRTYLEEEGFTYDETEGRWVK